MGARRHERCPVRKVNILIRYEEEDGTMHMLQRDFAVGRDGITALTLDVSETKHRITDLEKLQIRTTPLQYFCMVAAYDHTTNANPVPLPIDSDDESQG